MNEIAENDITTIETLEKDFKIVINNIKKDIRNTQIKTILQVNSNLIMLYYKIEKNIFKIINTETVL